VRDSSETGHYSWLDGLAEAGGSSAQTSVHSLATTIGPDLRAATRATDGRVVVKDAELLFSGHHEKVGDDLVLTLDGRKAVIPDYFRGEHRADLYTADGASLSGKVIDALAGHAVYAQAGGGAQGEPIGKVAKLVGSASVIRNGVTVELKLGDSVYKGDVVQAGAGAALGIAFMDGTAFSLGSNARMVLNEMVYDPNGSSNSTFLSLVQGSITFVAGQTAKNGSMRIDTPVATMGIRGTAVFVDIAADNGPTKFSVLVEPGNVVGSYDLYDRTTGDKIGTVNQAGIVVLVTPIGFNQLSVTEQTKTLADLQAERALIQQVFSIAFQKLNDANPKKLNFGAIGSGTTPFGDDLFYPFQNQGPVKIAGLNGPTGANGQTTTYTVTINVDPPPSVSVNPVTGQQGGGVGNIDDTQSSVSVIRNFLIADRVVLDVVSVGTAPFFNIAVPYVTNSGVLVSAVGPSTLPTTFDLRALLTFDKVTGKVTYDPFNFQFLGKGETAVYTITFDAYGGPVTGNLSNNPPYTVHTAITVTLVGLNDAPVFGASGSYVFGQAYGTALGSSGGTVVDATGQATTPVAQVDLTERPGVKASTAADSATITLNFTDQDFSDVASGYLTSNHAPVVTFLGAGGVTTGLPANLAAAFGQSLTFSSLTKPLNDIHGTVTLQFSAPDASFDYLAAGEKVTLSYTLTITDANGATGTETVNIVVTGTNDAPVLTADTASHPITELAGTANATADGKSGTLAFTDVDLSDSHVALAALSSATWSSGGTVPAATLTALATAMAASILLDSTGSGAGTLKWDFSTADLNFDFLAAGETLTVTYDVSVKDAQGALSTQTVTLTVTGTNDVPVLAADSGPHGITELAGTANSGADTIGGTLAFTDVDLTDVHTASAAYVSATWSTGGTVPGATLSAIHNAVAASIQSDSSGTGAGTLAWTFSATDSAFDFLAKGETLTLVYDVTVTDGQNTTSTQQVTVIVTGTNDTPALAADSGPHGITEQTGTGNSGADAIGGTLAFTDVDLTDTHTASAAYVSATWSTGGTVPAATLTAVHNAMAASVTSDSTGSGAGTLTWNFSATDSAFDFLAKGETLTLVYDVTVTDGQNTTSTKQVTVVVTGTNDTPALATDTGSHQITETAGVTGATGADHSTGNLAFGDVDLTDTHTVSHGDPSFVWSGGTLDAGRQAALTAASSLALTLTDSTGTGHGSVAFDYSAADNAFDFLAAGETLTITYDVTVTDAQNAASTQTVTVTVTGTNDLPALAADISTPHGFTEFAATTGSGALDHATGSLGFTDADLTDTHSASAGAPSFAWSGGTLDAGQKAALAAASSLALTVTDSTGSGSGTLAYDYSAADNAFDFLAKGETLTITYDVTVKDAQNATSTQTVTITVTGSNDGPVLATDISGPHGITEAAGATGSTLLDHAQGSLGFTDVDLTDTHVASHGAPSFAWSGGTLSAAQQQALTNASALGLTLTDSNGTGSGSIAFDYSAADGSFDFLRAGQTLTITYDVTVTDAQSVASTQQVTITVTGTNDAAVIGLPSSASVTEDVAVGNDHHLTATGVLSISDADAGEASFQTTVSGVDNPWGTLTLQSDGSYSYSVDNTDTRVQALGAGESHVDTFTVTALDGTTRDITFTINGTNDDPVVVATVTQSTPGENGPIVAVANTVATGIVTEDSSDPQLTTEGIIGFRDVDLNDHPVASATKLSGSLSGTLSVDPVFKNATEADGSVTWHYSVDNSATQSLAAGQSVTEIFNITIDDGHGGAVTQQVDVTVLGANDAPVLVADFNGPYTIQEAAGTTGSSDADHATGSLAFTDVDLTDLHIASHGDPSFDWSGGTLTDPQKAALTAASSLALTVAEIGGSGNVVFDYSAADKAFDFLAAGETLTITYDVTVSDAYSGSSTQPVTITVTGTNDVAQIGTPDHVDVTEDLNVGNDGKLTATGSIGITDVDHGQSAFQTTVTAANGDLGSLVLQTDGSYTYWVSNAAVQYLGAGETKVDTFTVTAADGTTKDVSFTIHGVNDDPTASNFALSLPAPTGNGWSYDAANGHYYRVVNSAGSWTDALSTAHADGAYLATITSQAEQDFITPLAAGQRVWIGAGSTDDATGQGHFFWLDGPESGSAVTYANWRVDSVTTEPNGWPNAPVAYIQIEGVDASQTGGWNDVPDFFSGQSFLEEWGGRPSDANVGEDSTLSISTATLLAHAGDVDANDQGLLTVSAVSGTSAHGATVSLVNGNVVYDPTTAHDIQALAAGETLTDTFTYTVSDGHGGSATATVSLVVAGQNDAADIGAPTQSDVTEDQNVNDNLKLTATGVLTISDADHDQNAFATGVTGVDNPWGTLTLAADGSYTYAVSNGDARVQGLGFGQSHDDTFTVTSLDGTTRNVSFTIHGANDDPVAADVTLGPTGTGWSYNADNGHYYRVVNSGPINWTDAKAAAHADGAYLATITSQAEQDFVTPLAANLQVWIGGGSFDDATGTGHFQWLDGPENGQALSYLNWRDGEPNGGFNNTATQYLSIEGYWDPLHGGWNDNPNYTPQNQWYLEEWGGRPTDVSANEDTTTTISGTTLLANVTDVDANDQGLLTLTAVSAQSSHGATVSLVNGNVVYDPTTAHDIQALAAGQTLTDTFTYTVSDGHGGSSTANVSLVVAGLNDAPVIDATQFDVSGVENSVTITGLGVTDVDATANEVFTLSITSQNASITSPTDENQFIDHVELTGTLADIHDQLSQIQWQPDNQAGSGIGQVTVTVSDGHAGSDSINFIFNTLDQPSAPVVLVGTGGKDVILDTGTVDHMTGGAGADQFVFSGSTGNDVITDFTPGEDKIDLRAIVQTNDINSWIAGHVESQGSDTLINLDNNGSIKLAGVASTSLHGSDFLVSHGSGL
jgi:VCBS repeat-containing protein